MAVLAAALGDEQAPLFWAYVDANPAVDQIEVLPAVAYVAKRLERTPVKPASFAYTVDGTRRIVDLEGGRSFELTLNAGQLRSLTIERISGSIGVTTSWHEPVKPSEFQPDRDVSLTRTVTPTKTVASSDLVKVELVVKFGPLASAGCHQVTELVPSGLTPVSSLETWPDPDNEEPDLVGVRLPVRSIRTEGLLLRGAEPEVEPDPVALLRAGGDTRNVRLGDRHRRIAQQRGPGRDDGTAHARHPLTVGATHDGSMTMTGYGPLTRSGRVALSEGAVILAEYSKRAGGGGAFLPRIVQVGIMPIRAARTSLRGSHAFRVTLHEEATGLRYRRDVTVTREVEARLVELVGLLHRWSLDAGPSQDDGTNGALELGRLLDTTFIGRDVGQVLAAIDPTALLLDLDETLVGLPWELLRWSDGRPAIDVPFGRIVTTGILPTDRRDPTDEDPVVRILAVVNPTDDLDATNAELAAIEALQHDAVEVDGRPLPAVVLTVLARAEATRAGLTAKVDGQAFDIIHFAGHGHYAEKAAHESSIELADGPLIADAIAGLRWSAPPYVVFNSSCESGRVAFGGGLRANGHLNALPSAFLAAGAVAYLGHFWPVSDEPAGIFASTFYGALFRLVNVGGAILEARRALRPRFDEGADLTAFGSVFFGDAGSAERGDAAISDDGAGRHGDDEPRGGGRADTARAA